MTISNKTTIKTYFETGDYPTQGQFADFIDSSAFLAEVSATQTFLGPMEMASTLVVYGGGALLGGIQLVSALANTPASASNSTALATTAFVQQELNTSTGAWTPAFTFATPGDLSVTYATQAGTYKKVGKKITVDFILVTSAYTQTTASGNLHITGLPFVADTTDGLLPAGALEYSGITKANYTNLVLSIRALDGNNAMVLRASGSGQTSTQIAAGDMPSGGTVRFLGSLEYTTI